MLADLHPILYDGEMILNYKFSRFIIPVFILSACASETINIAGYTPIIDTYQYDLNQYNIDLAQCRSIGQSAQAKYEEQQAKEQSDMMASIIVGALVGAAVGNAVDGNNDSGTTLGATYGAAVGASVAAENDDYDRLFVKFGPTAVVDKCLANRGYNILSREGYGGG